MTQPDFVIIGAMKCATSTLHEQLARQRGFAMSTPKEPCFFSDDDVYARGREWYESIFSPINENDFCGESSTHYTKLPTYPETVDRLYAAHPQVKLIYVMRHPVDRLISHFIHEWTQGVISGRLDDAIDQHPELVDYSRYSYQLEPFLETFGSKQILPLFFERMMLEPQAVLERVCEFLGHEGTPVWAESLGAQNVSSDRMRASPMRDYLVNLPVVSSLRRRCVPRSVRDRIKRFWTYGSRPELSPDVQSRVEQVFSEDLVRLGDWLDAQLDCQNYKSVVTEGDLNWSASVPEPCPERTGA